jgi:hypothetical protein
MPDYDFAAAYARILEVTGEKSQSGLARAMGVSQSSVWDVIRRAEGIPAGWLVTLAERHGVNSLWIKTGEGPMYIFRPLSDYSLEELHAEIGRRLDTITRLKEAAS